MNATKTAPELVDMYFLHMRSALLETAAAFDRIQAAESAEAVWEDARLADLRRAAGVVADGEPDRARRILELLSVPEEDA